MIGYYVHHHGSGHEQQLRCIAGHLHTPVTVLSSVKRPGWWNGEWIELPRDDDAPLRNVAAGGALHWAPLLHDGQRERGAMITAWIERVRPDLLVTDVSVEVALLARLLGVPVIVAAMRGTRTDRAHSTAYDLAHALLAPWPAQYASSDWPDHWLAKTWHVGAFSEFDEAPHSRPVAVRRNRVFLLWGSGGSDVSEHDIARARLATPTWKWTTAGLDTRSSRSQVWRELCHADVVITHAGQNAVAEVAAAQRPAIVVAQNRPHREQLDTALTLDRAGLATGLDHWPDAAELPALLEAAAGRDPHRWRRWSFGDGAKRAAHQLDRAASTLKRQRSNRQPRSPRQSACASL